MPTKTEAIRSVERMNCLFLSKNPVKAAVMHSDRDLITQAEQVCHLLASGCGRMGVKRIPFKATHRNHPSVVWVTESKQNYLWVWEHLCCLFFEYTRRYGRTCLYELLKHHEWFYENMPELPDTERTPFPKVFPDLPMAAIDKPVEAYRAYYNVYKADHEWLRGNIPSWFDPQPILDAESVEEEDVEEDFDDE